MAQSLLFFSPLRIKSHVFEKSFSNRSSNMASSTLLKAGPQYTKKLICSSPFCDTLFARVDERRLDLSIYVLDMNSAQNWEIKATLDQTRFQPVKAFPVICQTCKKEIGAYQDGKVSLFNFKIIMDRTDREKINLSCKLMFSIFIVLHFFSKCNWCEWNQARRGDPNQFGTAIGLVLF